MSNEDLPQSAESASAYLDDDLATTERAAAAADPEVMAAVESFTRVRAVLGDVEPAADSTKAAALAAALAEFDVLRAPASRTATPAAAATVISLQSRRLRAYRVVMGVAAAAVVVVGIAALGSMHGEDAKSSSSATEPPTAAAEALPQLKIGADAPAPAATAAAAAGGEAAPQLSEATLPAIDSRAELQQFAANITTGDLAASASPAPAGTAAPAAVESPANGSAFAQLACIHSDQTVIGEISYQGTPAFAVRNATTGALQALDATDCHLLDEVLAP
jgi:hypothetical protein